MTSKIAMVILIICFSCDLYKEWKDINNADLKSLLLHSIMAVCIGLIAKGL
jgi:hypothetical protein